MQRERPQSGDPDAGVVDDKIAEAQERIARVEKAVGRARRADDKASNNGEDAIETGSLVGHDSDDPEAP